MNAARNASDMSENFESTAIHLLVNQNKALDAINETLQAILQTLKAPTRDPTDEDVEAMAIYYLWECSGNVSEVVRRLDSQGISVRRQSLTEAKKFSRFQEKLQVYRDGELRRGHVNDDGEVVAYE